MTDITDRDRRAARAWAKNWQGDLDADTSAAARVILATVYAPTPTIADEIMDLGRALDQYGLFDALGIDVDAIADRVAQLEHDLTEARAEVERLTAANEELRRTDNYREFKEFLSVQKDAESNAESIDPADVKEEEPYHIYYGVYGNDHTIGVRIDGKWRCIGDDRGVHVTDTNIASLTRLVPAPRVITNTDELAALPHRTVIRDNAGVMFQRIVHGWYQAGDTSVHRSDDNFVCLPVTVLWEQEA